MPELLACEQIRPYLTHHPLILQARVGGGMGGWMGLRVGFININDLYMTTITMSVRGECGFMKLMK